MRAVYIFWLCCFIGSSSLSAQRHIDILEASDNNYSSVTTQMQELYRTGQLTAREYKHYKRWQISVEPHVDNNGRIARHDGILVDRMRRYRQTHPTYFNNTQRVANGHWTSESPTEFSPAGPFNGRLNCVAVDPLVSSTLYVGAAFGGIWKSINSGLSWQCLTDGIPVTAISDIAINPDNTDNIYALTGDADGKSKFTSGIIVSLDGGNSWAFTGLRIDPSAANHGFKLLMDQDNPARMFATTRDGIYSTTDGWQTWSVQLAGSSFRDILFAPGSADTLYASSWKSVYCSMDGGLNWDNLNNNGLGLPNTNSMTRVALAVTPDNPGLLYALYALDSDTLPVQGIYVFQNYCDSVIAQTTTENLTGQQSWYDLTIAANPNDAGKLFVGGVQLWKSSWYAASNTWEHMANGSGEPTVHFDIHEILHLGDKIYVATDGGLAVSSDQGTTWTNLSDGLNIMQFYDIDVRPGSTPRLLGGTQDNGTNQWDTGDTEGEHIYGGDGFEVIFDPSSSSRIYACTQNRRYKSLNNGVTWSEITPPNDSSSWDASWIMHPTNFTTLYCAFTDISRSTNRGGSWTYLNSGFELTIRAMVQGVDDPDKFYASDRIHLRSSNNINASTPTWNNLDPFLPVDLGGNVSLGGMTVDPDNKDEIWITMLNYVDTAKVYYSSTGGTSWTNITGSLPNVPVHCIAHHPGSNNGVYIGTDLGVFYRNANMSDWVYFGNGLPNTMVSDLKITSTHIYAGTFGRGIWKSSHYSSCPSENSLTQSNDPSSPPSTGIQVYNTSIGIVSTRIIQGGIGTDVLYTAGSYIRMEPGFEVQGECVFEAKIDGCPD